jgi:hypothetical protein
MRIQPIVFTLAATVLGALLAQEPAAERIDPAQTKQTKQERIAALKQSLAANQAALKQYTWTETTKIQLKGEVKKTEQKACQYGPDGKVIKTPIATPGQPPPQQQQAKAGKRGGRIKKEIVENKVDDMKDYMERVAALVHEYVPPDSDKIQAAQAAGTVDATPSAQVSKITIKNYLKQGDSVEIGFDTNAKKIVNYNVSSYLDKPKDDAVTLAVTIAPLADGTSHVQQTNLHAAAKKIDVSVTNSNYKKPGQ